MTRQRFTMLFDFLISVAGWGMIVFLLGMPVGTLSVGFIALIMGGSEAWTSSASEERPHPEPRESWVVKQLRADGSPVMRAIADGEYINRDRVDSLVSNHLPDAVVVSRSTTFCFYRGIRGKEVQGVVVMAENGRLTSCIVFAESGRPEKDDLFAPLPLSVCSEDEFRPEGQPFFRLDFWQGLQATTGGGGAVLRPVNHSDE